MKKIYYKISDVFLVLGIANGVLSLALFLTAQPRFFSLELGRTKEFLPEILTFGGIGIVCLFLSYVFVKVGDFKK